MRHSRAPARLLMAICLFASLAVSPFGALRDPDTASAFAPTNWKRFPGSETHESITDAAIRELDNEFFSIAKPTKTMKKAISNIVDANAKVDGDQTHAALHFDGESFPEGQARVLDLLRGVIDALNNDNASAARAGLGQALHTIQDFYAHSNWVELGNSGPNPDLGRPGRSITRLPADVPTCDGDRLITSQLTSGYYGGEDRTPAISNKCRHGGPFDKSPGSGGINKDTASTLFSPHASSHAAAAAAAKEATKQFIRDIKAKVTARQLKLLLGVGPTLGMSIDTTGSMGSVIQSAKTQAIQIVDARLGTDQEPSKYVLAPFNDPGVGPALVTDDPDVFKSGIGALFASGGGDCPELAMNGMLQGLAGMDDDGDLFMFTDASAKDSSLTGNVSSLATAKGVQIYPILFGSCSPIDPGYVRVANDSGGQVFVLNRSEAGAITRLADFVVRANSVSILSIGDTLSVSPKSYAVPVDSTLTRVTFSVGGATLTAIRPNGVPAQSGDPDVTIVNTSGGAVLSVLSPTAGTWTAIVGGSGAFSLAVSGESPLDLVSFRFVETVSGHDGEALLPIAGFPMAGQPATADAILTGEFGSAEFEFRSKAGDVLQSFTLPRGTDLAASEFSGSVSPPSTSFLVYVAGTDGGGAPFQRVLPASVTPQTINVTAPPTQDLHPGDVTTYKFHVTNLGPGDTFRASVSDDKGFVASVDPITFALATNEGTDVLVRLRPSDATPPGTSDTLTVSVESTGASPARNFAVLTSQVVVVTDRTPPTTTASISPTPNSAGWNNGDVVVGLTAVDDPGGSGVKEISYTLTGAQAGGRVISDSSTAVTLSAEGTTTLTYFASDNAANSETPNTVTIKIDRTGPEVSCRVNPSALWPPNHKLVPVTVAVNVQDALSGPAGFTLTAATSDEPDSGLGDGDTASDIQDVAVGAADTAVQLRAERDGAGKGRIYTLTYQGRDQAGNPATCAATATVPHDSSP